MENGGRTVLFPLCERCELLKLWLKKNGSSLYSSNLGPGTRFVAQNAKLCTAAAVADREEEYFKALVLEPLKTKQHPYLGNIQIYLLDLFFCVPFFLFCVCSLLLLLWVTIRAVIPCSFVPPHPSCYQLTVSHFVVAHFYNLA